MTAPENQTIAMVVPCAPGESSWRGLATVWSALPPGSQVILVGPEVPPVLAQLPPAAGRADIRWSFLQAPLGRAVQMNAGARAATGAEILWFVHADTLVPPAAVPALLQALNSPGGLAYFDLDFQADGPLALRLNAAGARWRSRALGLPFGDQALGIRREDFLALDGFPVRASGEDHAFVWRCRRAGLELRPTNMRVATSGRKYARQGWLSTTGRHLWLTVWQGLPEFACYAEERWLRRLIAVSPRSSKRPG